ncbi:MAG: hypothetical protein ACI9ZH_000948 [Paracoccaceae bacterium]|jgi:hypothetical protein
MHDAVQPVAGRLDPRRRIGATASPPAIAAIRIRPPRCAKTPQPKTEETPTISHRSMQKDL